jgi:hypothetical protein
MKLLDLITKRRIPLLLLVIAVGWCCSGCGATDAENTSQRPWNSPEGWQNGNAGLIAQPR